MGKSCLELYDHVLHLTDNQFEVNMTAACGQDPQHTPIDHMVVDGVLWQIGEHKLPEGFAKTYKINMGEITNAVESHLSELLGHYLTAEAFMPVAGGTRVALPSYLNRCT